LIDRHRKQPVAVLAHPIPWPSPRTIELPGEAARQVRAYGEAGDEMALRIFEQQAMALGRLFTVAANYTDPGVYLLGGGVVESTPAFRDWFMSKVREHTALREEKTRLATFAVVPDLDMPGARGAALSALATLLTQSGDFEHR